MIKALGLVCVLASFVAMPNIASAQHLGSRLETKAKTKSGSKKYITYPQELFATRKFRKLPPNKSMAVAPFSSIVGYSYRAGSSQVTDRGALRLCNQFARKNGHAETCWIALRNSQKIKRSDTVGPLLGVAYKLPDMPYRRGIIRTPKGKPLGILLALHGCNGNFDAPLLKRYANYLTKRGFLFVSTNSFADRRPARMCGITPRNKVYVRDKITRIRLAQARRTIRLLKRKYPEVPLYVWGHSEGGGIVQYLREKVAGYIASGNRCKKGVYLDIDPGIPFLMIVGKKDYAFWIKGEKRTLANARRVCQTVRKRRNWKMFWWPEGTHNVSPADQRKIRQQFASFMKILPNLKPYAPLSGTVALSPATITAYSEARGYSGHVAFVVAGRDVFGISKGERTATGAIRAAIQRCKSRLRAAKSRTRKGRCQLLYVNGQRLANFTVYSPRLHAQNKLLIEVVRQNEVKVTPVLQAAWTHFAASTGHRALAIGPDGKIAVATDAYSALTAAHRAAFQCSKSAGGLKLAEKFYPCRLLALDNQLFVKLDLVPPVPKPVGISQFDLDQDKLRQRVNALHREPEKPPYGFVRFSDSGLPQMTRDMTRQLLKAGRNPALAVGPQNSFGMSYHRNADKGKLEALYLCSRKLGWEIGDKEPFPCQLVGLDELKKQSSSAQDVLSLKREPRVMEQKPENNTSARQ